MAKWAPSNATQKSPSSLITTNPQSHQSRAEALLASSPSQALTHYTSAIDALLRIVASPASSPAQRTRARTTAQTLIHTAEALKKRLEQQREEPTSPRSIGPARKGGPVLVGGKLSVKEETLLLKSSRINGGKFPPLPAGAMPNTTAPEDEFV
jgi:hypothetical protein